MWQPHYRFSIRASASVYWILAPDGSVTTSTEPYYLPHAPQEWAEMERKLERSVRYSGLLVQYSPDSYTFVKEAATILRHIYGTYGPEAVAYFYVEEYSASSFSHSLYTTGKLDFSAYADEHLFVEVAVIEGGVTEMIAANEDTEVEIPLTVPDLVTVRIPSLLLQGGARWVSVWPPDGDPDTTALDIISMTNVDSWGLGAPITPGSANYSNDHKIFNINRDLINIHFKGNLNYHLHNGTGSPINYQLRFVNTPVGFFQTVASGTVPASTDVNVSTAIDFTYGALAAGTGVGFTLTYDIAGGDEDVVWENNNELEVTFMYHTDEFLAYGMPLFKLGEKIVRSITNNQGNLYSPFLTDVDASYITGYDNKPRYTVALSGDAIRGINTSPNAYPSIKTTFSDYFKALACLYDVGMDVSGTTVHIKQKKNYFNRNNLIVDLGDVKSCRFTNAKDHQYNVLKIGYPEHKYDEVNGRDEFNTTHVYSLPTNVKSELNLVNPYRADIYGIFFTWAKQNLSETADTQGDNEVFLVEIDPTPVLGAYNVLQLSGTVTGLELSDPNAFNFGLTPKRCFYRNRRTIYSSLYKREGQTITFQTTNKNAALYSSFQAGGIDEDSDVAVSSLGTNPNERHYIPVMADVTTSLPANIISLIQATPDGYISFTWRGRSFKMFPWEVGEIPASPKEQTIKGVLCPDNDLTGM